MAAKKSWVWLSLALVVAVLAIYWPSIERQLAAEGGECPWPFSLFHTPKNKTMAAILEQEPAPEPEPEVVVPVDNGLRKFTLEELKKHDGTNKELPILLAIGGKVVDVTSGERFYGPGKAYHQFAGTACTRALALSSLDKKDINDDVSDLSEEKLQEMEETKLFYYDKYPIVGELATN